MYRVTIPDCTTANILKKAVKNLVERRIFLIKCTKPPRILVFPSEFWGFYPFLDYKAAQGASTLMMAAFFSLKPILFDNTIMHLLHSCTHCDLDHSCSILHKSHDTATWSSLSLGRALEVSIQNYTGAHYQTSLRKLNWWQQQKI